MLSPDGDPKTHPICIAGKKGFVESSGLCSTARGGGRCTLTANRADRVEIETAAETESVLVLSDTYFPGWKADVDGRRREILRVNLAFRGLCLPRGEHRVTFFYRPASFYVGLAITIVGLCAVAFLVTLKRCTSSG
jgi:uncharacterized membrane protein YfhO